MKINWKLSPTLQAKAKKINDLKVSGMTYDQLVVETGLTRSYLIALNKHYEKEYKNETS